jgi:zinc protease
MTRFLPAALALCLAAPALAAAPPERLALETYTLPNGLTVILHPDHRLPQVVVDTWVAVGSKDEAKGRTGFAHLFEHLMFMGTKRVPGNQFDVLMETGGGANNASTSEDRTNYFSFGPPALLPTLLWLDADRFATLAEAMTKEKVDLQRDVVRNERRQGIENTPYGVAEVIIPGAMFPEGHPYHHPVIGSHEDLQAASLADVKGFFGTHYVPGNATLVVAGDFDPAQVKALVAKLFGAIPARPVPDRRFVAPATLDREVRRIEMDEVQLPRLYLAWHAPPAFTAGTAELDLLAAVLGDGPSSRLERRLVHELRLAESVAVYLEPRQLGSLFHVQVTGAPGADLERLKREALAVLEGVKTSGPDDAELRRARAQVEVGFRQEKEHLLRRADRLNAYRFYFGEADGFAKDLARYTAATAVSVRDVARRTFGEGRLDLRILPAATEVAAIPDTRPADLPKKAWRPPAPEVFRLSNGVEVRLVRQPGSGLFAGHLVVDGGDRVLPAEKAGLAPVVAELLISGAAGKSAAAYADAVRTLGASIEATAGRTAMDVAVTGLTANLDATLGLFADAVLRPNLTPADFEREAALALARVESRPTEPRAVASVALRAALFGKEDPRGRPVDGWVRSVRGLALADVRAQLPQLLDPRGATFVFAGDLDAAALRRALEARFGAWKGAASPALREAPAVAEARAGRLLLVDRPGAPQTVILAARPVGTVDEPARALRTAVNVALGGSFTSRLNQNLREKHGYTYGARSAFQQEGTQGLFLATADVQTEVTGPALVELRRELDGVAGATLAAAEVGKAKETARQDLVDAAQTAAGLAGALASGVIARRAPDALTAEAAALDAVDLAKANLEAKSGPYRFNGLVVVLVGDRNAITAQLEKAGLPAPTLVDFEGNAVAPTAAK